MKQLTAILRDSYREARNGWVLQVMLGLALLLVLFVASVSFRPTTVQNEMDTALGVMSRLIHSNPQFRTLDFRTENHQVSNPAEPWKADYKFDFVASAATADELKKAADGGLPVSRRRAERFFRDSLGYLDKIEVVEVPAPNDAKDVTEARFAVTTTGTKTPDVMAWRHIPRVLFAFDLPWFSTSLRGGVYFIEKWLVSGAGAWVVLFLGVVVTAGFLPSMLQKGALDLWITKPIGRPQLLLYKYLGGLTFVALLSVVAVGGTWLAIGLRTGVWSPRFLLVIPVLVGYFAVLYAVSVLAAVLTRSTIVAILATLLAWGLFWVGGKLDTGVQNRRESAAKLAADPKPPAFNLPKPGEPPDPDEMISRLDPDAPLWGIFPKWTFPGLTAFATVMPRTYQLDDRLGRMIAEDVLTPAELTDSGYGKPARVSWGEIVGVSVGFVVFVLGLACWRFTTRDG